MKYYSKQAINHILVDSHYPNGLNLFQAWRIFYWKVTDNKRIHSFCDYLEKGMSVYFAYKATLNVKYIKEYKKQK